MRVGFAGLGRMGWPMARNIGRAGHELCVWNRTGRTACDFAERHGAGVADTPRRLAAETEIVVTMLADDDASDAVHSGPDGLFAAERGAHTILEMGTLSPAHLRTLAASAPEGRRVIDAPVSGATEAASEAQLMIMAGCAEGELGAARDVLDCLGAPVICLGATGSGAVMKLAVNMLIHGMNQTLAEALALAETAGIDRTAAFGAIEASAAAAPMLAYRRPLYLDEAAHDVTFTVALAAKDMAMALQLAAESGAAMPQGEVTLAQLRHARERGYADRDMAAMVAFAREDCG